MSGADRLSETNLCSELEQPALHALGGTQLIVILGAIASRVPVAISSRC